MKSHTFQVVLPGPLATRVNRLISRHRLGRPSASSVLTALIGIGLDRFESATDASAGIAPEVRS